MTKQDLHKLATEWASGIPFRKIEVQSSDVVMLASAYLRQEVALHEIAACDEGRLCECRDIAERALAQESEP